MIGKYYRPIEQLYYTESPNARGLNLIIWKAKDSLRDQKKTYQKRIFGQHYNYSKVGLNKEKKFMIQEQRNTEIQRSNRILLEKIQKISTRSISIGSKRKMFTQGIQTEQRQQLVKLMMKNTPKHDQLNVNVMKSFETLNRNHLTDSRSTRHDKQKYVLFRGKKEVCNQNFVFAIFIQNNKYVILSEHNKTQQKIQMQLDSYQQLLNQQLDNNHLNIFNLLTLNDDILELTGINRQISDAVEHQEIHLPAKAMKKQIQNPQ